MILTQLEEFRQAVYDCLGKVKDAVFELMDAVLTSPSIPSFVSLCQSPVFRRQWPSVYAALHDSRPQKRKLMNLLIEEVKTEEQPFLAGDHSFWPRPEARDVWVGDRNFCTCKFLVKTAEKKAYFIIRQHASMPYEVGSELTEVGNSPTGKVFEQDVIVDFEGQSIKYRRVVVYLNESTRDGETEVSVFTNLIKEEVNGILVSQIYLKRWTTKF